jgi:hypothetical protein
MGLKVTEKASTRLLIRLKRYERPPEYYFEMLALEVRQKITGLSPSLTPNRSSNREKNSA